ncbi:MAG TPA: type II toxin-antitoxin system VapC family toxin [Candidatus Kryptonia bacterium]|nr:type II toxin-antitoxin system VapC family toxin [Candidatus Kryptonia bacterium]
MKAYVLDTHAFVWYLQGKRVPKSAVRAFREIDNGRCRAWIPAIAPIELALLYERRRSRIGVAELEATLSRNPELRLLPLDLAQAREFALLTAIRDPFDRLVVAAARAVGCPLLTADEAIAGGGLVQVIWD